LPRADNNTCYVHFGNRFCDNPLSNAKTNVKTADLNQEFVFRFRRWLIVQHYSLSTIDSYGRVILAFCKRLGTKSVRDVTPMDVGDFVAANLPAQWSDNNVAHQLGALRCFFDFLYLGGIVDRVAPRFLKARKPARQLPKVLTKAQIKKLIAVADNPRDRALVETFYDTGCRSGEMTRIRVEDINFRRRCFPVRAKRKDRVVYFGPSAAKAIRAYLGRRRTGYLFQDIFPQQKGYISHSNTAWAGAWRDFTDAKVYGRRRWKYLGRPKAMSRETAERKFRRFLKTVNLTRPKPDRPMGRGTLAQVIQELGRRAKLGRVHPHMLRHSFATHMLEAGADIRAIQELLGHSYLSSTQVYTRISNNAVAATFRRYHPRGG
jgi:site-specific recombinase XerD